MDYPRVLPVNGIERSLVLIVLVFLLGLVSERLNANQSAEPAATLSPNDVVRIQLEALGRNDANGPDSGIRIAFRFASPSNKLQTGPIEKFITILRNPAYVAMIDNKALEFGDTIIENNSALVPVLVTASNDKAFGYVFSLSRHTVADCVGCWMTDSVVPMPTENRNSGKWL